MSSGARAQAEIPDEELVRRFQSTGDASTFAELFTRHRRRVYCACRGFFGEGGVAEDATQEAFLRAFENIGNFVGGSFGGWLMRIAKNVCIDIWRRQRQQPDSRSGGVTPLEAIPADGTLEEASDMRMAVDLLLKEMKTLSAEQRLCLELKIEGFSYEETARRTGMSIEAVKSHLQNGRRMLWSKMEGTLSQLR